jgi:hypothetical protein
MLTSPHRYIALAIAKPPVTAPEARLARARTPLAGRSISLTLGIWAYASVGAAAAATVLVAMEETPDPITALSSVIAGYILALAATAFRAIRTL